MQVKVSFKWACDDEFIGGKLLSFADVLELLSVKQPDIFESKPDLCLVSLAELTSIALLPFSTAAKNEFPAKKKCISVSMIICCFKNT